MQEIVATLAEFVGQPCWNVRHGFGSFITAEFGAPKSIIRQGRDTDVAGAWHLWIYCCAWSFETAGQRLAHSESPDTEIARVVAQMEEQVLRAIRIDAVSGTTTFVFEHGDRLLAKPTDDPDDELWQLFTPHDDVICIKGGGFACRCRTSSVASEQQWIRLEHDLIVSAWPRAPGR